MLREFRRYLNEYVLHFLPVKAYYVQYEGMKMDPNVLKWDVHKLTVRTHKIPLKKLRKTVCLIE